ncbi:MAG: hypothetical protein KF842_04830 [Caulobacter sp.]|nr:hypothetical protein [Caulobacter sp.]
MSDSVSDEPAEPGARLTGLRLVFRSVSEFLLDEGRMLAARHDSDLIRALVWLALMQVAGDDSERGASVRGLARSLSLPFETARRKVHELEAAGLCRLSDDRGVVAIPPPADQARAEIDRLCEAFQALMGRMTRLGAGPALFLGGPPPSPAPDQDRARQVSHRQIQGFVLRALEAGVSPHGSILNAVIYSALISLNAERITNDVHLARRYASAATPPPDELRVPARPSDIAARIGLPYELVRRRLLVFRTNGWCHAVDGGYLGSLARLEDAEVLASLLTISQRFGQLVQTVAQTGLEIGDEAG